MWKDALRSTITIASPTRTTQVGNSTWTIDTRYTLKRKIGQGAFGQVLSAIDERSGKKVAVKKVSR